MERQLLFKRLARYYDYIYSFKDYKKEATRVLEIVSEHKKTDGKRLLEVACGTGKHLLYLKEYFDCTGIDVNSEMIKIARERLKDVKFYTADMVRFRMKDTFDVITCLFSSIGYVQTYENLRKTLHNFSRHLNPGGVLILEPWLTPEDFKPGKSHLRVYEEEELKIVRLTHTGKEDDTSILEMHYLIADDGEGVKYFNDIHEMGLFNIDKTLEIMQEEDIKGNYTENGLLEKRGLIIGVKKDG